MKVDFSQVITNLQGEPLEGGKFTLGTACIQALMAPSARVAQGGPPEPGVRLVELYTLAQRIHQAEGEIDLNPEEVTTIRERVAMQYQSPAIVGPVWAMLNG